MLLYVYRQVQRHESFPMFGDDVAHCGKTVLWEKVIEYLRTALERFTEDE